MLRAQLFVFAELFQDLASKAHARPPGKGVRALHTRDDSLGNPLRQGRERAPSGDADLEHVVTRVQIQQLDGRRLHVDVGSVE